jgi:hypothetical protein
MMVCDVHCRLLLKLVSMLSFVTWLCPEGEGDWYGDMWLI